MTWWRRWLELLQQGVGRESPCDRTICEDLTRVRKVPHPPVGHLSDTQAEVRKEFCDDAEPVLVPLESEARWAEVPQRPDLAVGRRSQSGLTRVNQVSRRDGCTSWEEPWQEGIASPGTAL